MILPLSSRSASDDLPEDYGNICSLTWDLLINLASCDSAVGGGARWIE